MTWFSMTKKVARQPSISSALLASALCPLAAVGSAQATNSSDLETELFGSPPEATQGTENRKPEEPPQSSENEPERDASAGLALGSTTTTVGGRADLSVTATRQSNEPPGSVAWQARPAAYLYLDSRPRSDTRGYLRVALIPESSPTAGLTGPFASAQGPAARGSSLHLLELWGKWQPEGSPIFWTAGRQPIRWGAAQFWNPTDFMSPEIRDPLASFDDRRGTDALRVNIPFESQNAALIFVGSLLPPPTDRAGQPPEASGTEAPSQTEDIQWAGRAEWSVGSLETALSFAWSGRGPTRTGLSLSSGLGSLDIALEGVCVARSNRRFFARKTTEQQSSTGEGPVPGGSLNVTTEQRKQACLPQGVAGLAWQQSYGNSDSFTIGGEYFWNGLGHDSPELELAAALTGNATPLYIGQEYAAAYALLPGPLAWDSTTFQVQFITNLSDASRLYRASVSTEILKSSDLTVAAVWRDGLGEFRLNESTVARAARGLGPATPAAGTGEQIGKAFARQTPRLAIDVTMSLSL